MAREYVAREIRALGGNPVWREGVVTDNGNIILDVKGMASPMPRLWKPASTASWAWSPTACSPTVAPTLC
jgi:hypothetical protein